LVSLELLAGLGYQEHLEDREKLVRKDLPELQGHKEDQEHLGPQDFPDFLEKEDFLDYRECLA
jgi:hypothetical protein